MGDVTTAKESSAPSNPDVQPTVSKLLGGLQQQYDAGVPVYNKSLYAGVGGGQGDFDGAAYLAANSDVKASGMDPYQHYLMFGQKEGRQGSYRTNPGVTTDAWNQGIGAANSLIASGGFNGQQSDAMGQLNGVSSGYGALRGNGGLAASQTGAMNSLGGINRGYADLAGAYDQDAPGFATMRQTALDDAITGVTAGQLGSGLLGSRSYIQDAAKAGVNAIAPLDYQNFQNGINNRYRSLDSQAGIQNSLFGMGQQGIANQFGALAGQGDAAGSLFSMGQQGLLNKQGALGALGAIGSAQDADRLAARQGENDAFRRQNDAGWERLARSSAILGGTAPYGGTESSTSVPWWAAGLGAGATLAGAFL